MLIRQFCSACMTMLTLPMTVMELAPPPEEVPTVLPR